jgi:hypothetical protein
MRGIGEGDYQRVRCESEYHTVSKGIGRIETFSLAVKVEFILNNKIPLLLFFGSFNFKHFRNPSYVHIEWVETHEMIYTNATFFTN